MRAKILIWTGVGIILITLVVLVAWAALSGILPKIEIKSTSTVLVIPRLNFKVENFVELFARTAVVPLRMFANALQITMSQFLDAFRMP